MDYIVLFYLYPLLLTLAAETPIYYLANKKSYFLFIVMASTNCILNVLMNLLLNKFNNYYYPLLIGAEAFVYFFEGFIVFFMLHKRIKGFYYSFIANSFSFGLGLFINQYVIYNFILLYSVASICALIFISETIYISIKTISCLLLQKQ